MKRDFREEYTNYIESDMPDLWSRIEPNLKEKTVTGPVENITDIKNKKNNRAKIYRFIKVATPVAAGLCILVIGVGVMSVSNKSEEATMDSAAAMEEAYTTEETVEEELVMEEAAAEEAPAEAPIEDFAAAEEAGVTNGVIVEDSQDVVQTESAAKEEMREDEMQEEELEIAGAILLRIAKASESEQEMGFAYIYVFQLEDGSKIEVYVTDKMCDELEETGSKLQRQKNYRLTLNIVSDTMKQEGDILADYILLDAEELP